MRIRQVASALGALCILVSFVAAGALSLPDAYALNPGNRLAPSGLNHLLGTDDLGRDLFSRFVAGTRYTILTGLMTTFLAVASGCLMGHAALTGPRGFGRAIVILAYACFVAPSVVLAPSWRNRWLTLALCALGILPLFLFALIAVAMGNLTGWTSAFALGPLFGVGIAYAACRVDSAHKSASVPKRSKVSRHQLSVQATSVFAWSVYLHAVLDNLGLGVQPPEPSWGNMLTAQSASWSPNALAILGLLAIGITSFSFGDMLSKPEERKLSTS